MERFEQQVTARYLLNLLGRLRQSDPRIETVSDAFEEVEYELGLDAPDIVVEYDNRRRPTNGRAFLAAWSEAFRSRANELAGLRPSLIETNLQLLGALCGLQPRALLILGCLIRLTMNKVLEDVFTALARTAHGGGCETLAALLGVETGDLREELSPSSRLINCGLVSHDRHVSANDKLKQLVLRRFESKDALRAALLGPPAEPKLDADQFQHVADELRHAAALIRGASESGRAGVHILLHGPVGTGKTEFCKTAAALAGVPLLMAGEQDDNGFEPDREERLFSYCMAQALLDKSKSVILFDEIEDLFGNRDPSGERGGYARPGSKVFVNRILETAPVPTLWTTNSLSALGAATLRRMTYAIELKNPPSAVRRVIWRRALDRNGVALADAEIAGLAQRFKTSPALIETAAVAAHLAGGGAATVERTVASLSRMLQRNAPAGPQPIPAFDPALTCTEQPLAALTERLVSSGLSQPFSLCLYGPPGTGKSAFARHLAEKLGLDVLFKRASDILSPWVGGTERNIAEVFEDAIAEHALLCIDEADSFLMDRRGAVRSWEVTQVNEMLTWMESHPLPFVCTTNLMENLDGAALRRFTFKIAFDYLAPEQVEAAFRRYFRCDPPHGLRAVPNLTPEDFVVAAKRAALLGVEDPVALLDLVIDEADAKRGKQAASVGFRLAS